MREGKQGGGRNNSEKKLLNTSDIDPRGGDAFTDITSGRMPVDSDLWDEDTDREVQARANNQPKIDIDNVADPASIIGDQEEDGFYYDADSVDGISDSVIPRTDEIEPSYSVAAGNYENYLSKKNGPSGMRDVVGSPQMGGTVIKRGMRKRSDDDFDNTHDRERQVDNSWGRHSRGSKQHQRHDLPHGNTYQVKSGSTEYSSGDADFSLEADRFANPESSFDEAVLRKVKRIKSMPLSDVPSYDNEQTNSLLAERSSDGVDERIKEGKIRRTWEALKGILIGQRQQAENHDAMVAEKRRKERAFYRSSVDFKGAKYTGPVDEQELPHGEGVVKINGALFGFKFEHGKPQMTKQEALDKKLIVLDKQGGFVPAEGLVWADAPGSGNFAVWPSQADRGNRDHLRVIRTTGESSPSKPSAPGVDNRGQRIVRLRREDIRVANDK